MLHASTGSSLFSIMRGCSRMSRSVSFASSSSSSSARVRQRRGDWTTVRVHAQQEKIPTPTTGRRATSKTEIQIVRERDERHGPERFSGHETRGIRDAERSKSGEKSNTRRRTTSAKRGDEHGLYQGDVRSDGRVVSFVFTHRTAAR